MNKLSSLLAAGLIVAASTGLAATPVFAATAPTMPNASVPATAATKPTIHHAHARKERVERVQKALNTAGANLKVDGIWGPKTMAAVKDFQKNHGLKTTGHLNKATRRQLNLRTA